MEDKIRDLNKLLKVMESRNELLSEEIKRNEENIKKIENEISIILDTNNDSSQESSNVDIKNNINICYNK
jgi:hypothetical protein